MSTTNAQFPRTTDLPDAPPSPPPTPPQSFANGTGNGTQKNEHNRRSVIEQQGQNLAHWEQFDACSSLGSASQVLGKRKRGKGKDEGLFGSLRAMVVQHQIGISINLILLLALTHICFPRARRRTRSFFLLSYYSPITGRYAQGPEDFYLVAFYVIFFTGLRDAVMTYLLIPWAQAAGLQKTKLKLRFAEQAWLVCYYAVFWSMGMYIWYNKPYWFNFQELWTNWPTRSMSGLFKWYYLVQFAFWLQQIIVVHIEERRKDHWQMFTHHIVTCVLILLSYGHYETKAGNVVLCIMDSVDLIFPAAKMLKYTGHQTLCDLAFGLFVLVWFLARHVIYLCFCYSIWRDVPNIMMHGCYSSVTGAILTPNGGHSVLSNLFQPFLDPDGVICHNHELRMVFLALLLFLQCITILWFGMILRVAWRVLKGGTADDTRSDDEGENEESEEEYVDETLIRNVEGKEDEGGETAPSAQFATSMAEKNIAQMHLLHSPPAPLEETIGVESLHLRQRRANSPRYRSAAKKSGGHSAGGLSDRKELLGRIGCDKPN